MSNFSYYNENNPKAAAWLRELIKENLIAPGDVDQRSIEDVAPQDLDGYTQHHFFAGIGGWSYALRLAGWPDDRPVWTGSCPCQPFSAAGARKGLDDERHLWPIWRWLIDQCRPAKIFGEQVASPLGRTWLAGVQTDLEALGYGAAAADLCAAGLAAPHIRQRLWWLADAPSRNASAEREQRGGQYGLQPQSGGTDSGMGDAIEQGLERHSRHEPGSNKPGRVDTEADRPITATGGNSGLANAESQRRNVQQPEDVRPTSGKIDTPTDSSTGGFWCSGNFIPCADGKARRIEPGLEPLVIGLPGRVGLLRGYGNAIVPQIAAVFIECSVSSMVENDKIFEQ